jgi:hypothetical protein
MHVSLRKLTLRNLGLGDSLPLGWFRPFLSRMVFGVVCVSFVCVRGGLRVHSVQSAVRMMRDFGLLRVGNCSFESCTRRHRWSLDLACVLTAPTPGLLYDPNMIQHDEVCPQPPKSVAVKGGTRAHACARKRSNLNMYCFHGVMRVRGGCKSTRCRQRTTLRLSLL